MNDVYDVWFSLIDINNESKVKILNNIDSKIIWNLKYEEFFQYGLKANQISKILDVKYKTVLEKYYNYLEKNNIKLICFKDKEYPRILKNINNFPVFLYVRGNLNNLYDDNVAIIGSRNASEYGKYVARKISKEIADKNVNVVSGLALGIDKYAHLGCLDSNIGRTIAVLGTGVSNQEIYPLQNKKVFERILENEGTIVSEFKIGTKPEKYNFPLRNRIISGLSKKVIVVEAEENSGSLITVNYALEQGKDIYAIPGNINSKTSKGTNKLIMEGAILLDNIDIIFEI